MPLFMISSRRSLAFVVGCRIVTVLLLLPSVLGAGIVETVSGKIEGKISFLPNAVKVDEQQVASKDILYLYSENSSPPVSSPELALFRNGEVVVGGIVFGSDKQVDLSCKWFGRKSFDLKKLSVLQFISDESLADGANETLYRKEGQPIPGALVWIDEGTIGLDSPFGALKLIRSGLVRYVLDKNPSLPLVGDEVMGDEIGLSDGNVFRGRLHFDEGKVRLTHPVVGEMAFPVSVVRFIARHRPTMVEINLLKRERIDAGGGILAKGKQFSYTEEPGTGFIRSTRIEPQTKTRYAQPERSGGKLLFRTTLCPLKSARGMTRFTMSVGSKTVLERTVSPSELPQSVEVQLPEGEDFVVEVDFGPLLRFPCGVILRDAHLVVAK